MRGKPGEAMVLGPGGRQPLENRGIFLCVGLAMALLAAGYAWGGRFAGLPLVLAVAGLWLLGGWRGWRWADAVGLAACCGLAATGVWLGLGVGWMIGGLVAALSAWDLTAFDRWLQGFRPAERAAVLLRRHLWRLLIADAAGLLLAGAALALRLRLGLVPILLLGLAAILAVSRVVAIGQHQTP